VSIEGDNPPWRQNIYRESITGPVFALTQAANRTYNAHRKKEEGPFYIKAHITVMQYMAQAIF